MQIRTYQYTESELNEFANQVRSSVISSLLFEKFISEENADLYNHTHFVTIAEKFNLFPWFKKSKNTVNIYISKLPYQVRDIPEKNDKSDEDK